MPDERLPIEIVTFAGPSGDVSLTINDATVSPVNATGGGISAYATGINTTTLSIEAIGITNGGSVTVNWKVAGVI